MTETGRRAAFLDRDGVINELVYYPEQGVVDSPFITDQFSLVQGAGPALRRLKELGFDLVVVSNQPGVAKGQYDMDTFGALRMKMATELLKFGVSLDGEYYCLHHPKAKLPKYRVSCACRKPEPGLILEAAADRGIILGESYMIGDGLVDVGAGKKAGCVTILIGNANALLFELMGQSQSEPDFLVRDIGAAVDMIEKRIQLGRDSS
jgi:D-glycero-D-manno-heptose 1,7-bisphosphate phosphatase